jgi:Flp pilus assembly secretin CpaC
MGSSAAVLAKFACILTLTAANAPTVFATDQAVQPALAHERETISMSVDFTEIVRLARPASTIVMGNPGIADATLADEHRLILTGRSTGATNVIVLDAVGDEIANMVLRVSGPLDIKRYFFGTVRRTHSCNSRGCESILSVGDAKDYYDDTKEQIEGRQEIARPE